MSLRRELNAHQARAIPLDVRCLEVRRAGSDHRSRQCISRLFREARSVSTVQAQGQPGSFCAANEAGTFRADGKRIKLPVIGWIRMREEVRFSGPLKRATVSCEGGRWFVALMIDTDDVQPVAQPAAVVGVDLGVTALATLSTGEVIEGPRSHKAALKRLRRLNKAKARKRRGSANFRKAKARLTKLHARIANIRRDATHKLTTDLTKTYRGDRHRGPERARHVGKPASGACSDGWRLLRVSPAA